MIVVARRFSKWKPKFFEDIEIPGEASLVAFPLMFSKLQKCDISISNWPKNKDALGFEKFESLSSFFGISLEKRTEGIIHISNSGENSEFTIDIRDNIDLITPLTILMGISNGGII